MENHRNTFVLSLLAYAAQRNVSAQQLCSISDIDLSSLKTGAYPPVTQEQLSNLWLNASRLTNDTLFGLHFGESLQLAALGIVGEIIKSSRTVGEAITVAASLIQLISDEYQMEVKKGKQTFSVVLKTISESEELSFTSFQMRDLIMVFVIHELDGLMLTKIKPTSVKLSFDGSRLAEYERVLRCRPVNKRKDCILEFPIGYWNEMIITSNYALQGELLKRVTTVKAIEQTQTLEIRIRDYLMSNAYLGILSLDEVAANFNVSPRSLQRMLNKEGVTFQQIADGVRKSLAEHYLRSGNYQVKEISNMLGYNELSAFSRAFKRWTGKAPIEYQA